MPGPTLHDILIEKLLPDPSQPRTTFLEEELRRLAASIAACGLLQPLRVRWDDARGSYIIIAGECRWRAARMAGLKTVPCIAVEGELSEADILAEQVIENSVRSNLNATDFGRALGKLKLLMQCSSRELAERLGLSSAAISRAEALLSLPESIQAMVDDHRLAESAAYEISRLPSPEAMFDLANLVVAKRLNRDQVIEAVRGYVPKRNVKPKASRVFCKLDGGICFSLSAREALTWDDFNAAIDRVRKEAKKLYEGGKAVTDLARVLKTS